MTGSIAVSQCGHTPNRPGHHGTVVASTVGTVAISCNEASSFTINIKAARDFCPDVICRHLNVYCNCGLLSIALGTEDTYVDFSK